MRKFSGIKGWILFITLVTCGFTALSQFSQIRFEQLDSRDGLSHNRVTSIYQDQLGFMWFGTSSGLNRYDGTEIKVLQYDESDPYSINNSNIIWVKEGPHGRMWVKTSYGVFAYDVFKEKMIDITGLLDRLGIDNYNLNDVRKDGDGNYWFHINGLGIKKYVVQQDSLMSLGDGYLNTTSFHLDRENRLSIIDLDGKITLLDVATGQIVKTINYPEHLKGIRELTAFIDQEGDYWFYSTNFPFGVCYFNPQDQQHKKLDEHHLGSRIVSGVIQDQLGNIVIGADHGGISIIFKRDWSIQTFKNNPSDPKSLSHNTVISLYEDRNGLIWLGINKEGVNYYSPKSVSIKYFKNTDNQAANENDVLQVLEDARGNLWLGTDGGGLNFLDRTTGTYKSFKHDPQNPQSIGSNIVVSMAMDAQGDLWLGSYMGGLSHFNGKTFKRYVKDPSDPNAPSDNSIWNLYIDSNENLWIGTLKAGVDVYDKNFKKRYSLNQNNGKIISDYTTSFHEGVDGKMWIGTGYGLCIFDPATQASLHLLKQEGDSNSLSNNSIITLYRDQSGDMWIGTMYGLNKYDYQTGNITSYTKSDGLPSNIIVSITEDNKGHLWLGTYQGLSKMTIQDGKTHFENFDLSDGLQGDMFNERSVCKTADGELIFGGKNGINSFYPHDIETSVEKENLVFLNFYLSNQLIRPDEEYNGRKWFEKGLNQTSKVDLKHDENSFTIEFTSLCFYQQENKVYKYRLVGFDNDWIVRSNVHRANYTNLDPGKYRFEVMSSDQNHQFAGEPLVMNINIAAPLWKTPAAYTLYVLVSLLILFFTRRAIIRKERFRAKIAQERLESERLHELDLMKIRFFTNVSHEFRTPLSLILTPVERLLKHATESQYHNDFQLIHRNAKRLLTLVNQLLDFRRIEMNQHKLSVSGGDLVEFVRSTVDSFSDLSNDRHIRLEFKSHTQEFLTLFDGDKMEKILFNLLSNAFKFTHAGGSVSVELKEISREEDVHLIQIQVKDTGIGIPQERQEDIFKRFFQVDNTKSLNLNHGSGIGLSITREFVEMHNGQIWVESEVDKGSAFILQLPMKAIGGDPDKLSVPDEEPQDLVVNSAMSTLLLAEDNADFRFYLKDNLKQTYNIQEAHNGKVAWKKIVANPPDLVVTDLMMPEMSGIDLCRKIKKDPRTAHIPIILLTAHYSDDQKIEAFEAGAMEYITKPFNFEILVNSINSAVQLQKLIHAAEHRVEVKPAAINIIPLDEQFINKALKVVEENISNADFSVQELSRELAVSRGQLYKKTLELTGKTPIEFIRFIRLQRAAALLEKSQLTVAEVAYKVGFNNPKYFARYFKAEYKVLPSQYSGKQPDLMDVKG